ncbi:MAG: protein kinase, partial [Clostridia bacterium]|nr:protein kinase [Clostridia bacterium]
MQNINERIRNYVPFFGKWDLDDPPKILGEGNSGTVYLVHADDAEAALKVIPIPKDDRQYSEMLARMNGSVAGVNAWVDQELRYARTEIQIMERLKSDSHIVCFEDAAVIPRTDTYGFDVIIRMERLVRLDTFLRTCDRYGFKRGTILYLRIWSELVSGLAFCERCSITHLDVKPDNIFYAEPSRDYFKLGDFGVSIRSENNKKAGVGMIVGTRDYMSPEINAGAGGDIRSDMYSLAVVMYELFNDDRLPFVPQSG